MANKNPKLPTLEQRAKGGRHSGPGKIMKNLIGQALINYIKSEGEFYGRGLTEDLLAMSPRDRAGFLVSFLPYEIAKLQTIEQVIDISGNLEISREERIDRIKEILMKVS